MGGDPSPSGLTFYLDASIQIAVRQAVALVRPDVVYAGAPGMPPEKTWDEHWLPVAGENDWVVLLRDKRVRTRPWEREALLEAGVRAFCLTGAGNYTRWRTLHLLVRRWEAIEKVARTSSGPYIYSVTQNGVNPLQVRRKGA